MGGPKLKSKIPSADELFLKTTLKWFAHKNEWL
jgi:hypothetical protein